MILNFHLSPQGIWEVFMFEKHCLGKYVSVYFDIVDQPFPIHALNGAFKTNWRGITSLIETWFLPREINIFLIRDLFVR